MLQKSESHKAPKALFSTTSGTHQAEHLHRLRHLARRVYELSMVYDLD